jgi:hypothetical protein
VSRPVRALAFSAFVTFGWFLIGMTNGAFAHIQAATQAGVVAYYLGYLLPMIAAGFALGWFTWRPKRSAD